MSYVRKYSCESTCAFGYFYQYYEYEIVSDKYLEYYTLKALSAAHHISTSLAVGSDV